MRRWLAVLAAVWLAASAAYAADETISGQRWVPSRNRGPAGEPMMGTTQADTLGKDVAVDASGRLITNDINASNGLWTTADSYTLFTRQFTAIGQMDSNNVATSTRGYRRMWLYLAPTMDSLTSIMRVAVQIRACLTAASDSTAAIPWYRWPRDGSTAISDADSIGQHNEGPVIAALTDSLWSGEFKVGFNQVRQSGIQVAGGQPKVGAGPRGMWIPLVDISGAWFWSPYTTVRVRMMSAPKSRFLLTATLVGSYQ